MGEVKTQHILMPKQVYIGDTAELRCTFNSSAKNLKLLTQDGTAKLSLDLFGEALDFSNFEVKQISLSPAGVDFYQLTVTFVPWKTGSLQFPPVILGDTFIEFQPVEIKSLLSEKQTALKESEPPILLPGTTYKLYAAAIISVILLILIIRLIIKHRSVSFFIKNLILMLKCWRSRKVTEKKLTAQLYDTTLTDKVWAENTQKLMRKYLSIKYQIDFSKKASSEILPAILEITAGLLEDKNESLGRIAEIFVRTDYIRYSAENKLLDGEKHQLTADLLNAIERIENKAAEEAQND